MVNIGKILLVMSIAYVITSWSIQNVFIANGPQLKHDVFSWAKPKDEYKKIYQGVYAVTTNQYSGIEVRESEVEWIPYTYVVNGKEIKLRVPKGMQPPSQKEMDLVYGQ